MIAVLFSGQGAQYPGMGVSLYEYSKAARDIILKISEASGLDIPDIFKNADAAVLQRTDIAQPSIFALSAAGLAAAAELGFKWDCCAGFSLGECTAIYSAGILGLSDTVKMIMRRGELMQFASDKKPGSMYAVMGLETEKIEKICGETSGYVRPVNYNCPGQCVIAGDSESTETAAQSMLAAGASKTVRLQVAGAFHSELMRPAAKRFEAELASYKFSPAKMPVYSDITAEPLNIPETGMPRYLAEQMASPVRFEQIIRNMLAAGVDTFVEYGPGRTLTGFVKRISRDVKLFNVEKAEDVEKLAAAIG